MNELDLTQTTPLARDASGVLRVAGSRVTLDSVIHQFKGGAAAEQIQEDFPSLALSDIYSVIAYYLQHVGEVEEYLDESRQAAGKIRGEADKSSGGDLRERLRRRRAQAAA
jgi:uncharacterized protein (DUF433 family)